MHAPRECTQVKGNALPKEGSATISVFFYPGKSVNGFFFSFLKEVNTELFFVKGMRMKSAGL